MRRVSWVLAAVALVMVLATGGVLGHAAATQDDTSDQAGPTSAPAIADLSTSTPTATPDGANAPQGVFDPELVDYGGTQSNAMFEVPKTADWTLESSGDVVGYADKDGNLQEGVTGGASYKDGFCPLAAFSTSSRAFVGFTHSIDGTDSAGVAAKLARSWVAAIAQDSKTGKPTAHTPITTTPVTLTDGSTATMYSSTISVDQYTKCDAPQEKFSMVSLVTGANTADLVMVRDAGVPDALDNDTARTILDSLQRELTTPSASASPSS